MTWSEELTRYLFSTVAALLPIVNPLAAVGMVMGITANLTDEERARQVRRACIYMFLILTTFLIAGGLIMNFFGISIPGLRITGGLIISYLGFKMLFPDHTTMSRQERDEAIHKHDVSFMPLAMPTLSGPGSIAVIIGIASTAQAGERVVIDHMLVAIGIAITAIISYWILRAASRLNNLLGATGMNAVSRIMGFLMICIGVQFCINGVLAIVKDAR
ncbi:MAG: MarC family NAAT transporter [Candidatus Obscuribacterales bacterium]|nr:MarC family NAAT transporter [Steroidobacteraceae bacterium]